MSRGVHQTSESLDLEKRISGKRWQMKSRLQGLNTSILRAMLVAHVPVFAVTWRRVT